MVLLTSRLRNIRMTGKYEKESLQIFFLVLGARRRRGIAGESMLRSSARCSSWQQRLRGECCTGLNKYQERVDFSPESERHHACNMFLLGCIQTNGEKSKVVLHWLGPQSEKFIGWNRRCFMQIRSMPGRDRHKGSLRGTNLFKDYMFQWEICLIRRIQVRGEC